MYNILVTGVGAVIGYGIIKSLKRSKYVLKIFGMDMNPDAIGKEWCDAFIPAFSASDASFPSFIKETVRENSIDLIIPGIEQDLNRIAAEMPSLSDCPAKFAINKPSLIKVFNDKWDTHNFFKKAGIELIPTFIDGDFSDIRKYIGVPMLMKPRRSYASKGIQVIENEGDYLYWKGKLENNFMVQKKMCVSECEFTVSIFGLGNGQFVNLIALKRRLGPDGATVRAEVVFDKDLITYIERIVEYSCPLGPTNIQLIKHDSHFLLLEINPRISSSTSIRQHFGINEAEMCVDYYVENRIPEIKLIKKGRVRRYLEDYVEYGCDHI